MNAIELLKADHQKVKSLFEQVESSTGDNRQLFQKIKAELDVHTHIEEEIFYPRIKEIDELREIVLEGVEEHHQVKVLIREIEALTKDSEKFEPKLKVLIENVEHHIEEEEDEMFPQVEEFFDAEELEQLGRALEEEKRAFNQTIKSKAVH